MSTPLDDIDRRLVLATQEGLPLVSRPFEAVAAMVGIPAAEVLDRLARLRDAGVIRRIAAVPNHYRLGYVANAMTVWDVADGEADRAGALLAGWPGVSHCYRRPRHLPVWPYSVFAMLHCRDRAAVAAEVAKIAAALGPLSHSHQVLFSTRILKKTGLRLTGRPEGVPGP